MEDHTKAGESAEPLGAITPAGLARAVRAVWRPALLWFALLVAVSPKVGPIPVALGATGVLVLARTRDRQAWELVRFIAGFVALPHSATSLMTSDFPFVTTM